MNRLGAGTIRAASWYRRAHGTFTSRAPMHAPPRASINILLASSTQPTQKRDQKDKSKKSVGVKKNGATSSVRGWQKQPNNNQLTIAGNVLPAISGEDVGKEVLASSYARLLNNSLLVVQRELEWGNIILGFEQANKYSLRNEQGVAVGYIAEELGGITKTIVRNVLTTNRAFKATIFDDAGKVLFTVRRPVHVISSTMYVYNPIGEEIGQIFQRFHVLRRKYDIYLQKKQIAEIDMPMLSWDFVLKDEEGGPLASVNKDWTNLTKELFTDASQYVVRMDALQDSTRPLTLDERAIVLATAITIDFDYFSRHSGSGVGILPYAMAPTPMPVPSPPTPPVEAPLPDTGPAMPTPMPDDTYTAPPPATSPDSSSPLPSSTSGPDAYPGEMMGDSAGNYGGDEIMNDPYDTPGGGGGGGGEGGGEGGGGLLQTLWDFFSD
eukprot:TRINITY_DN5432_c0_g2_i2.p1 TRINITY_DN5432_c0_g2~~TRINITY_DN5432_c0_g2_i2.p1  ORF type:complete len:437 (-),score=163.23 TRINITY_DN5432_c0_g2_i2:124-1434(-)